MLHILAAVLLGVACVASVEILLRLAGVAEGARRHDPFVGFSSSSPLFESATSEGTPIFRVSAARVEGTLESDDPRHPRRFLADKPENGFRIFVIGGSSAAGVPYSPAHSFSGWLARILEQSLPDVPVEVVNVAFSGYASRRVLLVAREIERYEPDLVIVYSGHNEWAERRFYAHLLDLNPTVFRLWEAIANTRLYRLTSALLEPLRAEPDQLERTIDLDLERNAIEMFAVLDTRIRGENYPSERELQYRDMLFEHNLREITSELSNAGSRLMILSLGQNFSDWKPGASRHRDGLEASELGEWEAALDEGRRLAGDCPSALTLFRRALAIDDEHAELHYEVARCLHRTGRLDDAREHYRRASDLDQVPHGGPSHFNALLSGVAEDHDALFVDVEALFEKASGDRLVGDDLFVDYIHPNLRAHQLVSRELARVLRLEGLPVAAERWRQAEPLPEPDDLHAHDPTLRTRELEMGIVTCRLARRWTCARAHARELIEHDPENALAITVLEGSGPRGRPTPVGP